MAKPTSLAAQLKRDDEAERLSQEKEDLAVLGKQTSPGKVWVRLVRAHYDTGNNLHLPGIVQLDKDAVPSSAKILSGAEAAEAKEIDEAEEALRAEKLAEAARA